MTKSITVPVEPTSEMLLKGAQAGLSFDAQMDDGVFACERRQWAAMLEAAPSVLSYQARVAEWMMKCFGAEITNSLTERCFRFFEEAGELCQALGMTEDQARDLVIYTWSRDKGEPSQEVGGVMVTLAAMCHAGDLDMVADGEAELARIDTPETIDKIRRKHDAKTLRTSHSALPGTGDGS